MAIELEVKTVVPDPGALRAALTRAGATRTFRGMMRDRRLDREGTLSARDEVLRVRTYQAGDPPPANAGPGAIGGPVVLAWKGPASVSADGHKHREELECQAQDGAAALALFTALGYDAVHIIDRFIEVYQLTGATVRLEWYPRMDVLAEVEGEPAAMEAAIKQLGIPRATWLSDPLPSFTTRYEARTGRGAVLEEGALDGETPSWTRQ